MKKQLNSKGFGAITVLVIVLVVAALGGGGYYVWHKNHTKKTITTSSTSKSSSQSKNNNTTNTQAVDPYAGWKTYTDSQNHYSFKYPSDWTLTSSTDSVSIRNAANTVLVSYTNPFVKDGGTAPFYTTDIQAVSSDATLKIVGGALTVSHLPVYAVVDASTLASYPLTVGDVANFTAASRFADKAGGGDAQLIAFPVGKTFTTNNDVKAWFGESDAQTSLLILKSLAYNK